jgi:hypothetical protein
MIGFSDFLSLSTLENSPFRFLVEEGAFSIHGHNGWYIPGIANGLGLFLPAEAMNQA